MNTTTMPTVTFGLFLMQQIVKFLITIQGKKHPGYLFSVAAGLSLSLKICIFGKISDDGHNFEQNNSKS
jgi:hypothetical protein